MSSKIKTSFRENDSDVEGSEDVVRDESLNAEGKRRPLYLASLQEEEEDEEEEEEEEDHTVEDLLGPYRVARAQQEAEEAAAAAAAAAVATPDESTETEEDGTEDSTAEDEAALDAKRPKKMPKGKHGPLDSAASVAAGRKLRGKGRTQAQQQQQRASDGEQAGRTESGESSLPSGKSGKIVLKSKDKGGHKNQRTLARVKGQKSEDHVDEVVPIDDKAVQEKVEQGPAKAKRGESKKKVLGGKTIQTREFGAGRLRGRVATDDDSAIAQLLKTTTTATVIGDLNESIEDERKPMFRVKSPEKRVTSLGGKLSLLKRDADFESLKLIREKDASRPVVTPPDKQTALRRFLKMLPRRMQLPRPVPLASRSESNLLRAMEPTGKGAMFTFGTLSVERIMEVHQGYTCPSCWDVRRAVVRRASF
jgi:hypothetical protein